MKLVAESSNIINVWVHLVDIFVYLELLCFVIVFEVAGRQNTHQQWVEKGVAKPAFGILLVPEIVFVCNRVLVAYIFVVFVHLTVYRNNEGAKRRSRGLLCSYGCYFPECIFLHIVLNMSLRPHETGSRMLLHFTQPCYHLFLTLCSTFSTFSWLP